MLYVLLNVADKASAEAAEITSTQNAGNKSG